MHSHVGRLLGLQRVRSYRRATPLILVNGLAEQSESWFSNRDAWSRHFDVKVPELLVYDGEALHRHIERGGEVTVAYLTLRLAQFLDEFVQRPPYDLVGSSLGGQVVVNYAATYPDRVSSLVLLCPSGFHGGENLPVVDGVRRSDYTSLVRSVFHQPHYAHPQLVAAIERKFGDRRWKKGVLRTLRGTLGHSVGQLLPRVTQPTLIVWGEHDRVLSDVPGSMRAAARMPGARQVVLPGCGHAPQIEKARLVNQLVVRFLKDALRSIPPALDPAAFLDREEKRGRLRVPATPG